MNAEIMTEQVLNILSELMFTNSKEDYCELLEAVEELRYFLRYDLQTHPLEYHGLVSVCEYDYIF